MADVYEPREDSFLLAENLPALEGKTVLDMGTGSGFLALLAAKKARRVVAVDINPKAIEFARATASRGGAIIEFRVGDLFSNVPEKFDVILFNPPYLPYEDEYDKEAHIWCGGKTGRETIERFAKEAPAHLNPGGAVALVFSSITGEEEVRQLLEGAGFSVSRVAEAKVAFEKLIAFHGQLRP